MPTITFTNLPAVDVIDFELLGLRPATSSLTLKMFLSTTNGASWLSTGYSFAKNIVSSVAVASQEAGEVQGAFSLSALNVWPNSTSAFQGNGIVQLFNNGSIIADKSVLYRLMHSDASGHIVNVDGCGAVGSSKTSVVNAVRFSWDNGTTSGNFAEGTITCRPRRANVTN